MNTIRKVGLAGIAALALGATSMAMTTPAAAQRFGHGGFHRGIGPGAALGVGLAAGAIAAGAYPYYGYGYGYGPYPYGYPYHRPYVYAPYRY